MSELGHLNGLFFINVHPADFARPGEYLLVDSVGLGTKGCVEICHVSLEDIHVQGFHPGVAGLICLHALYLQLGKFGKLSDWHSDFS